MSCPKCGYPKTMYDELEKHHIEKGAGYHLDWFAECILDLNKRLKEA